MNQCTIQFHATTGQMMVCEGAQHLDAMFERGDELQALDRETGDRYLISVNGEEMTAEKITLH